MAAKTKRISTLIESQLPEFITTEYELFGQFVQKYYEQQEVQGGVLDIANNFLKYRDIDFYEKKLLKQNDTLSTDISETDDTIVVLDASSFPENNGYIRINDEIIFYEDRNQTTFFNCSRGVSGNTTLGDLYDTSKFESTNAASHNAGSTVHNVSNLFLYAFIKSFENQYLGSFPEKYLRGEVDKRTLIKNIQKFYKAKGTASSIKFIFNTIVTKDIENKPEVYNPKDFTYKASTSDWVNVFALKCKIVSGDPKSLIGKKIVQQPSEEYGYASATVDNVRADGTKDGEVIYNIIVAPETVNGEFGVSTKTVLEKALTVNAKRANVHSTLGWKTSGSILIDEEIIEFDDKTTTQFVIKNRPSARPHSKGASVYKPVTLTGQNVVLLSLGIVYNATVKDGKPFSAIGDKLQVSNPGFETSDVTIVNTGSNTPRWNLNVLPDISATTNTAVSGQLGEIKPNVSSIFGDDQYYYITSSSFPSHNILDRTAGQTETVKDQKILRIIRKEPIATTERYKTSKRDVGLLLNGVPLYSYKDLEDIQYGLLEKITVANRGRGYVAPPYVLVNGLANKAKAVLVGSSIDRIEVNTTTSYTNMPSVEVTSGRGGVGKAIVTDGQITSIQIENPGEFYSSPPIVRITDLQGKGRFADFSAVIDPTGQIIEFVQNAPGNLYTQQNVRVDIIAVGQDGSAVPTLKTWTFNRYEKLKSVLDTSNGQLFENYDPTFYFGYGCVANPVSLRQELNDNITGSGSEPAVLTHSPILGFAYDGNPIYGPYGYVDPTDPQSAIRRMTSSYVLKENRQGGPTLANYPIGSFTNDYEYLHRTGSLDENNGRFCITPDYPEGTYAYFMTLDANLKPAFPYTVGDNFYSLPVDSNYNSNINQNDVPKNSKRLFVPGMQGNGEGLLATIDTLKAGTVQGVEVEQSSDNFSVNSKIFFDNQGTEGFDAEAIVSSVKGKPVAYLQSREDKVVKLTTIQSAYLFEDDFLRQPSSGASGQIVGTVQNDNLIVLKNVVGTFDSTGTFSADIKTFTLFLDQDSSYTKGAIISLTDGINDPIATGEVLEGTSRQNSVVIKVLSGTWVIDENYTLRSDNLFNTVGSRIVVITSLSDNLNPFDVNQSVALIETTENHGLGIGDKVTIDVNPDDALKTKTYYLRKKLFQNVTFITPSENTSIVDTGLGRFKILNGGAFYTEDTYTDVPLTGGSGTGAKATIRVSAAGIVNLVTITDKGSGYKRGDYLGVDDEQLVRSQGNDAVASTQRLVLYVAHVGFAKGELILNVDNADGFADNDLIQIGEEVVKIADISGNAFLVERAQEGSEDIDHFDGESVSLYKPTYHFTPNYEIDPGNAGSGFIKSYDQATQTALIEYNYSSTPQTASVLTTGQRFFDPGNPKRLVTVATAEDPVYKYEFSEDNVTFVTNPNIQIQEFYKYVFDTSHSSLTGTFFELSPSTGYSLLTLEKVDSAIAPGNPGSFSNVKFGFGPRTVNNDYSEKVGTNYTNFYYFDKNGVVDAEEQYFSLINDPLQGEKVVTYVTRNRFVYDVTSAPLFDGSGTISYTTSGQFAIGKINTVGVINLGSNYKKPPIISGVNPSAPFKGTATVLFDDLANVITGVRIDTYGLNYSKPIALVSGNGTGAKFQVTTRDDGSLFAINIISAGRGYTEAPTIEIVESDVRLFVESNNIGVPASVTIQNNGGAYHLDKTVSSTVTSKYTISTINRSEKNFIGGEKVTQTIDGEVVLRAVIAEITPGSNLIKLEQVRGIVREGVQLKGVISEAFATVKTVFVTEFDTEIRSFYDNIGYYTSDRGRVSTQNQRLTDSFFYQDYSYVVKSKTSIEQWRDLIKSTTHPAGFKLFGQVDVETDSSITMPDGRNNKSSSFSTIELWDPEKNKITSRFEKQVVTNTIVKVENTRIRKTAGSASSSEFDFASLTASDCKVYNMSPGFYDDVLDDGKPWYTKNPFDGISIEEVPPHPISAEFNLGGADAWTFWNPQSALFAFEDALTSTSDRTFVVLNVKLLSNKYKDTITFNDPKPEDLVTWPGYNFYDDFRSFVRLATNNPNDDYNESYIAGDQFDRGERLIPKSTKFGGEFDEVLLNTDPSNYGCFLIDLKEFGRSLMIWGPPNASQEDISKNFAPGDQIRWYPFAQTGYDTDAWIDFEVQETVNPITNIKYSTTSSGVIGTKTFQLRNKRDQPFTPYSAENLIVTLDGILQEPGVSYTVNQDKITFATPPLGTSKKLTGGTSTSLSEYQGTRFTARHIEFKDASYNDRYFRKIRNIFQRNGRWIDAANQIDRNIDFIINESVGYGREKYPDLDWSTKLDDYQNAVRYVAQSFDHDLRFGGNTKTSNYAAALLELQYISRNKAASLDIFKYATKLSNLAIRNWDTTQAVSYIVGSHTVNVTNSDDLAIGMYISSGRSFPDGTRITEIIDRSTIRVSRAPFVNSGGGGGAVFGETSLDGETNGTQLTIPTSIGVIEPGNEFAVTPGDTFTIPLSFAGTAEATFYMSGINNGTFYDAANLIEANKEYLQSEISNFTWDNYPDLETNGVSKEKCFRDIGYLVDAMVHHLKFGGNERVVRFGQLYYTQGLYPYGEDLTYLKTDLEQEAADYAWNLVGVLAIQAMRNTLPAATYGSSPAPVVDNDVAVDSQFPYCVEVESAINSMITIVKDIIDNGPGSVISTAENENKSGNWTPTKTYSNYAIIPDPELPDNECTDVISALLNLYDNLEDVIYDRFVEVTRPDFINGEETVFDLYWENGDPVISEKDENILLTVNAVLQQTKFNAEYPGQDSYYVNRDTNPNQIVFDVAPVWDQDIGAKTLGEPTNVERVTGHGVGNYKRLTIDPALINNVRSGPFLILDLEDLTVQPVDDPDFLMVFIDGVLQQPGASYSVSGPNIQFTFPITDQMKVDMRYVYGRDIGQVLRLYDYEKGRLFAKSELRFTAVGGLSEFLLTDWREVDRSSPLQIYQVRDNGFINFLGQVIQRSVNGNTCYFSLFGQKAELLPDRPLTFTVKGNYSLTTDITFTDGTLVYQKDLDGKLLMSGNDNLWYGTRRRFDYRTPFVNIANGDLVKIDGEEKFRRIKDLPTVARTKDERLNSNASDAVYGTVQIERYNGITRGEGLSVVATVTNGVVTDLTWNQRSYDPITQPTAYQYYTPPILHFIPKNGSGGGARAAVIVSKGQVLSIELISGGEGYTEAPDVVVARRYTIYTERDVATAGVGLNLQPIINPAINVISNISVLGNQRPGINTFTSILFRSPIDHDPTTNQKITSILHLEGGLERNVGTGLGGGLDEILQKRNENIKVQSFDMDTVYSEINISLAPPWVDEIDIFSASTLRREHYDSTKITNIVTNVINNTQLSNASAFAPGAFLDVDLDPTDNVIYIPDTSLFSRTGELLVGDEVIKYYLKLGDRFMKLRRGQQGTTAKFWPAGTFIRELPDDLIVTTAVAGVVTVQSVADVTSLKAAPEVGASEQTNTRRFEDVFVRMSNVAHRNITAEIQIGVDLVSISEVQLRHDTKYELRARAISMSEIIDVEVETDIETDVLVDTVTSVSVLSARIHPDVITQVASSSTIRTEAISVIPYESVFSVDYTEHKETIIEQELWKFLDANTWEVTQTILDVTVRPTVTSTSEITVLHEIIRKVSTEPLETAFDSLEHKETTVEQELWKFLDANTWEVTQTILDVTVRPTVTSTSEITILNEIVRKVSTEPLETAFDSLEHKETTVLGELWKFLDANTWEVTETVLEVTVKPTVVSTYQTFTTFTEAVSIKPAESVGTIGEIFWKETTVLGEVKKLLTANTFEVTQTILDVTLRPTVVSTSQTFSTFTDAIAVRPSESVTSINSLEHKETTVRGEVKKLLTANTFEVTQTILDVTVKPTVVSTSQTFNTFTDAIAVRPSETVTEIGTISHKETFVRFERDQFSDLEGIISFNFEVTETNVGVKINPTSETVSFISHASEVKAEVKREPTVVSSPPVDGITEIVNVEVQTVLSQFTMQKNQLEVLLFTPPSGVVDGYAENVLIADPILTRDFGFIDLVGPPYTVTKRDATTVDIVNQSTSTVSDYIGSYEKTNAGHTISHFDGIFDDGSAKASGVSLEEFSLYFPSLTIRDFELRGSSSYTLAGIRFNLMPPSIQDPVAISATTTATIGGIITVQNSGLSGTEPTKYFTDSGYLFTSGGTVIQYTSKTATTFEGCSVISGPTTLTSGDDLIPFQN